MNKQKQKFKRSTTLKSKTIFHEIFHDPMWEVPSNKKQIKVPMPKTNSCQRDGGTQLRRGGRLNFWLAAHVHQEF